MPGSRRMAAVAAIGAVTAGLVAGSGSAAEPQRTDALLGYTCQLPSGELPAEVRVTATFPATGLAGVPIEPTEATAALHLPAAAVADLAALRASTVSATARLTVMVTQAQAQPSTPDGGTPTEVAWAGLTAAPVPLPEHDELAIVAAGPVPPVVASAPGEVSFTASDLAVELAPQQADGSSTEPAALAVRCTLNPGQDTKLATVKVSARTATQPAEPPAAPKRPDVVELGPDRTDQPPASAPRQDEIPPECGQIPPIEPGLATGCTFVTGFSNVTKLNGAVFIEAALLNVALANFRGEGDIGFQDNRGDLPADRFPPSTATFLTFGFMPIKAKMELTQVGVMNVDVEAQLVVPFDYLIRTTSDMSVRIFDVTVNGVPLDVGPNCRTAEPMHAVLSGGTPDYTNIFFGGPLDGIVTIPPFSGCGVHEDLDPLLTGSVSGPNNYVKLTQGNLCSPPDTFCPPTIPVPLR